MLPLSASLQGALDGRTIAASSSQRYGSVAPAHERRAKFACRPSSVQVQRRGLSVQTRPHNPAIHAAILAPAEESLGDTSYTRTDQDEPQEHAQDSKPFEWAKHWYPVAFVHNLDPKVPHPVELLGQRLVIWRDARGEWCCFEDKCPHRLAPLSEGRIEPSDGTLMCSYHGWRFRGDGKCTDIPQSLDAKAKAAACANPRSCAQSHPTMVLQGKVWVWGEGGAHAFIDSAAVPPAAPPELAMEPGVRAADGGNVIFFLAHYHRHFPYGWDVLAENLLDPSHVNFSHHGIIGLRDRDDSGTARISAGADITQAPSPKDTLSMEVETFLLRVNKVDKWLVKFVAPCLIQWIFPLPWGGHNTLCFHIVPTAPGKSLFLGVGFAEANKTPLLPRLMIQSMLSSTWWRHLTSSHKILDGDTAILHWQGHMVAEEERGSGKSWRQSYYMPAQADRYVAKFRQWLDERGGGGPTPFDPSLPLPKLETSKDVVLDRWNSHTRHCKDCRQGLRLVQAAQVAAAVLGTLCALGLSVALGRGVPALSKMPALLSAGALLCLAGWAKLRAIAALFMFEDYSHSHNH